VNQYHIDRKININ